MTRWLNKNPGMPFLAPAAAVLAAVTVYPLAYVLWLSSRRYFLISDKSIFTGFENYIRLWEDPRFWNALYNTVYFTAVSVSLEVLLGLGLAVLLNRAFAGKGLMRAVIMIPWAIPTVVSARMWEWMYNADFGVLNYVLGADINWLGSPAWAMNAAIAMDVWKTTPFVTLLLMAGLSGVPEDLYKAAKVDGASAWMTFRRITLPFIMPILLVTLVFRTIDAFRIFDAIYVLTGGGPANRTETLSIYAYKILFQTLQFGYGATLSVVIFMMVGLITVFYVRLLRRSA